MLAYFAFGSEVQTVILVNLDTKNRMVQSVRFIKNNSNFQLLCLIQSKQVQLIYALAILLSVPLQFFPAVRILENGLFTRSGKADPLVKWQKNGFRFLMVMACTVLSWAGAADLDKFVALVGCFAWCGISIIWMGFLNLNVFFSVPLCYCYPAMLHYKAVSRTRKQKLADIVLIIFGFIAAAYTTIQTLGVRLFSRHADFFSLQTYTFLV